MNPSPNFCHDCKHRLVNTYEAAFTRNSFRWRCGALLRLSLVDGEEEAPLCVTVRNATPYSDNAELLLQCGPQGKLWEKKA